jgi:catechol 2,3-dioxygenase-like lactoylglutathione lyase family enzyme
LDHLVILVRDLDAATENYRRLGFTVAPGGRHADGATHNVLVVFADDTYLELVAFTRRFAVPMLRAARRLGMLSRFVSTDPSFGRRLRLRAAITTGLVDFVLVPAAIVRDIEAIRERGLAIDGPISGGRLRPDGQEVAWQLGFPHAPELPFLCGDVTPRALRVPTGEIRTHANGALAIASVTVEVPDLEAASAAYGQLLGSDPVREAEGQAVFSAGTSIVLRRGKTTRGPMQVTLEVAKGEAAGPLDHRRTEGVEIDMVPSRERQS